MNYDHYTDCAVAMAEDLVNTAPGPRELEELCDLAALAEFLRRHRLSAPGRLTGGVLAEIRALRPRLRAVFEAADAAAAAELVNVLLREAGALPQLTDHDGDWHLHFSPPEVSLARRLLAESAMGLAGVLRDGGFDRLRTCGGDDCADVFVDTSRNRSRRYCNPDTCGNRANVAAYRARHRPTRA